MYDGGVKRAGILWPAAIVALAGILVGATPAQAERTFRIRVKSEPAGATVATEAGETLGETPFSGRLRAGRHTLIVSHDGYQPGVLVVRVRRRRRAQTFRITLEKLPTGMISVTLPDGVDTATVRVDGEVVGEAPGEIEVPAGPHQVEIEADGFETYAAWIQVVPGEPAAVVAEMAAVAGAVEVEEPTEPAEPEPAEPTNRPAILRASAGLEIGGRKFTYRDPETDNLRPYDAGGVPRLRLSVDVFPLAPADNRWLRGIALTGRFAIAPTIESTTADDQSADTSWNAFAIGARALFPVTDSFGAGVRAAYGREQFTFSESSAIFDEIPSVSYETLDFGAMVAADFGDYGLFGGVSFRSVLSAGDLADRFRDASVSGLAADVAGTWRLAKSWQLSLGLAYARYSYDFVTEADDAYRAQGAIDSFLRATVAASYLY